MSNSTVNIEVGSVLISTVDGWDFEGGKFNPSAARYEYSPNDEIPEGPWRVMNPSLLVQMLFDTGNGVRAQHEGDIAGRIKDGTVRFLTEDEKKIAAAYDAAEGYSF